MFYKTVINSGVCSPSIVSEHGKAREDIPCGLLVRSVAPCALFGGLRSRLLLGGFNGLLNRLSGLLGLSLGGLLLGFGRLLGLGGLVVAEEGFADHGAGNGAGGGTHHVGHEAAALLLGLGGSGVRGGRSLLGGRLIGGRSGGGSRLRGGLRGGGGTAGFWTGFTEAGRPMEKPEERLTLAASAPEVMARSAAAVRRTSLVLCISN